MAGYVATFGTVMNDWDGHFTQPASCCTKRNNETCPSRFDYTSSSATWHKCARLVINYFSVKY